MLEGIVSEARHDGGAPSLLCLCPPQAPNTSLLLLPPQRTRHRLEPMSTAGLPPPCSRDASSEMRVVFVSWGVCLEAASGRYKEETDKERIRRAVNCLQSLGAGNI